MSGRIDVLQDRRKVAKNSNKSIFKQDVSNTFGIDAKLKRKELEEFALSNPVGYKKFRTESYVDIVQDLTEYMYEYFWELLTDGKFGMKEIKNSQLTQVIGNRDYQNKK